MFELVEGSFDLLKFSERLKSLMEDSNHNTYTLAEAVSLSPGTISKYANAKMEPKRSTIELLAKYFRVNPVWLMGYEVEKYLDGQVQSKTIPFFGTSTYPSEPNSHEVISAKEDIDLSIRVSDNSMMNARIFEGDTAYIKKQHSVENGKIAAVVMDGIITLRRIHSIDSSMVLHSENPTIPDVILSKKDRKDLTILGEVVCVKFKVR